MAATGAIEVRTFLGNEALPVSGAGVHIVRRIGDAEQLVAYRTTDKDGKTEPVVVETPDADASAAPGETTPFSNYDIRIRHPDYHRVYIHNVQAFPNTITRQLVQMIPSSERLGQDMQTEQIFITPQQL